MVAEAAAGVAGTGAAETPLIAAASEVGVERSQLAVAAEAVAVGTEVVGSP